MMIIFNYNINLQSLSTEFYEFSVHYYFIQISTNFTMNFHDFIPKLTYPKSYSNKIILKIIGRFTYYK